MRRLISDCAARGLRQMIARIGDGGAIEYKSGVVRGREGAMG